MMGSKYYRGGQSLEPDLNDVHFERGSDRLRTTHGVSVFDRPDHPNLEIHGGAYLVGDLPRSYGSSNVAATRHITRSFRPNR